MKIWENICLRSELAISRAWQGRTDRLTDWLTDGHILVIPGFNVVCQVHTIKQCPSVCPSVCPSRSRGRWFESYDQCFYSWLQLVGKVHTILPVHPSVCPSVILVEYSFIFKMTAMSNGTKHVLVKCMQKKTTVGNLQCDFFSGVVCNFNFGLVLAMSRAPLVEVRSRQIAHFIFSFVK